MHYLLTISTDAGEWYERFPTKARFAAIERHLFWQAWCLAEEKFDVALGLSIPGYYSADLRLVG